MILYIVLGVITAIAVKRWMLKGESSEEWYAMLLVLIFFGLLWPLVVMIAPFSPLCYSDDLTQDKRKEFDHTKYERRWIEDEVRAG